MEKITENVFIFSPKCVPITYETSSQKTNYLNENGFPINTQKQNTSMQNEANISYKNIETENKNYTNHPSY